MIDKLALIYIRNNKILMTRSTGKSVWYIPGGKREPWESDEQTLVREIQEELGVDIIVSSIQPYGVFSAQAHGKAEGIIVQMTCYRADFTGTPTPEAEIEELGWFDSTLSPDDMSPVDRIIFADLKKKGLIG